MVLMAMFTMIQKKRFFNGAQIHTSPVVNIDTYLADGYIQTVNSVYRIIV